MSPSLKLLVWRHASEYHISYLNGQSILIESREAFDFEGEYFFLNEKLIAVMLRD